MPDIFPHYAGAMLTCGKGSKTLRYLIGFWGEYRVCNNRARGNFSTDGLYKAFSCEGDTALMTGCCPMAVLWTSSLP